MSTLDKIMKMKKEGISENDIIKTLQKEGVSPKEISDALTQSQIKSAVSSESADMQPSMMGRSLSETPVPQNKSLQQETTEQIYQPGAQQEPQKYYPPQYEESQDQNYQEYYPQQNYQDYSYSESSVDGMIEISEQVFSEKIKSFQKQLSEINEVKTLLKTQVENIHDRLKRMEKMFDQMQISVIEKVGTYGKGLENLKKEIEMVEDSFSKVVDKVVDSKTKNTHKKNKN